MDWDVWREHAERRVEIWKSEENGGENTEWRMSEKDEQGSC